MKQFVARFVKGDYIIWAFTLLLSLISILAVYSSSGSLAFSSENTFGPITKHMMLLVAGIIAMWFVHNLHYKWFYNIAWIIFPVLLIMLIYALATRSRWLVFGPIGFQPSEIAKYIMVVLLTGILSRYHKKKMDEKTAFIAITVIVLLLVGFITPENLSTGILLSANAMIVLLIGRFPLRRILMLIGCFLIFAFLFYVIADKVLHQFDLLHRIDVWQGRLDKSDESQQDRSMIAIANGFIPAGPGNSQLKYWLPQAHSDFIFAIILEEWGILLGALLIFSYMVLFYRTGVIVRSTTDFFPGVMSVGIMSGILLQAFLHMFVCVGLGPVTGQTLPFVSMGGTSLIFTGAAMGMILSASRYAPKIEDDEAVVTTEEDTNGEMD